MDRVTCQLANLLPDRAPNRVERACGLIAFALLAAVPGQLRAQVAPILKSERAYVWLADTARGRDLDRDLRDRTGGPRPMQSYDVDLDPVLDNVLSLLGSVGIPLREDRALAGRDGIAFSAAFRVNPNVPSVRFHVGDCGPFDAFYADRGFRWALTWPLPIKRSFSLQLQGGEDNEFGSWAIGGIQWRHAELPLAVGIGIPVALGGSSDEPRHGPRRSSGGIGGLVQFRMLLD
ncbi:MAG: hypothetical protein AB7N53_19710 [Candidatus Binatia bacterium]